MEELQKAQADRKEGRITDFKLKFEIDEKIIFDVVDNIINDAETKARELLITSKQLISSIESGYERDKKIHSEIKSLYDRVLSIFEDAKLDIAGAWKQVKLLRRYAFHLGYEKKFDNVKKKLIDRKEIEDKIADVTKRYDKDISKCDTQFVKATENIKQGLNYDEKLSRAKKDRDDAAAITGTHLIVEGGANENNK
jgi:membrane-associated HD superfamily phosphohydrolase